MGCCSSKQAFVLDDGTIVSNLKKEKKSKRGPASPVVTDDAPPWVTGHRVLRVDEKAHAHELVDR
jgi:hypothetical protein